jgi:4-hydroxyproline epimerase
MKDHPIVFNYPPDKHELGGILFYCIDAHTCGNPVRLVAHGGPTLEGSNMSEKRQHFLREFDWIRKSLMFEPRGHDMMSGSILYPPHDPVNDFSVLFIETSGCLPMCGHGTVGTMAIETGKFNLKTVYQNEGLPD